MPVEDVGSGVGYFCSTFLCPDGDSRLIRFDGLGSVGEDGKGSNAGSKEGAGRFTPATAEPGDFGPLGEESLLGVSRTILPNI